MRLLRLLRRREGQYSEVYRGIAGMEDGKGGQEGGCQ
jgi:hypothetical protein